MAAKITTRDTRDPGGKLVDSFEYSGQFHTFMIRNGNAHSFMTLGPYLLFIASLLKKERRKEFRNLKASSFTIWGGFFQPDGFKPFYYILFPEDDFPAFSYFSNVITKFDDYERYLVSSRFDTESEPWLRYDNGKIVIYMDPYRSASEPLKTNLARNFEIRSAEIISSRSEDNLNLHPPPSVQGSPPDDHGPEEWLRNRERILDFCFNLCGPIGYDELRSTVINEFGIPVYEEDLPNGLAGLIKLKFSPGSLWSASPRILISSALSEELKYVSLAHELGHYTHHLEFLQAIRLTEETSWRVPELRPWLKRHIILKNRGLLNLLEDDADEFASFFLIPPSINVQTLFGKIIQFHKVLWPEEIIWQLVAQFFPYIISEKSMLSMDSRSKLFMESRQDIASAISADQAPYMHIRLIKAAMRVQQLEATLTSKKSSKAMPVRAKAERRITRFCRELIKILERAVDRHLDIEGLREEIRTQLSAGDGFNEPAGPSLDLLNHSGELIPPVHQPHPEYYVSVPMYPTPWNLDGALEGEWFIMNSDRSDNLTTINEMQSLYPSSGLVLYRMEQWQKQYARILNG